MYSIRHLLILKCITAFTIEYFILRYTKSSVKQCSDKNYGQNKSCQRYIVYVSVTNATIISKNKVLFSNFKNKSVWSSFNKLTLNTSSNSCAFPYLYYMDLVKVWGLNSFRSWTFFMWLSRHWRLFTIKLSTWCKRNNFSIISRTTLSYNMHHRYPAFLSEAKCSCYHWWIWNTVAACCRRMCLQTYDYH